MDFKPCDPKLFFTRGDANDPRLGEIVRVFSDFENIEDTFVIVGYPDDEGIKLNGGRPGSSLAPTSIRKAFYKMTPGLNSKSSPKILDCGDIDISVSLSERHDNAFRNAKSLLEKKARVLTFGGGHDYGFSDCSAFVEVVLKEGKRPLIINFDAHLDVRPDDKGENSGTSFYRLLKKYSGKIDFFEVGIQDWCNSTQHCKWAIEHGAKIITLNEILSSGRDLNDFLAEKIFGLVRRDHQVALSLDIDAFPSGAGPGASQVFPVGLDAQQLLKFWKNISAQFKPRLTGIYEVSPPLDLDDRTSRLAALFAHQIIFV
jgi:formiminoglutamase